MTSVQLHSGCCQSSRPLWVPAVENFGVEKDTIAELDCAALATLDYFFMNRIGTKFNL